MSPTPDLKRLRYVTSNFFGLQGLRQAALGVMMLLMIPVLGLHDPWSIWLFGALLLLLGFCWWRIGIYYERRLGYVEVGVRPLFWGHGRSVLRQALFWSLTILLSVTSAKMIHVGVFTPGWALGILFVGFFVLDDRPWYYLPFAVLFFVLAVLNRTPRYDLLMAVVWLLPFAFIITGILDHLLLVRSLAGARSNGAA
jgi:hypothetical protein